MQLGGECPSPAERQVRAQGLEEAPAGRWPGPVSAGGPTQIPQPCAAVPTGTDSHRPFPFSSSCPALQLLAGPLPASCRYLASFAVIITVLTRWDRHRAPALVGGAGLTHSPGLVPWEGAKEAQGPRSQAGASGQAGQPFHRLPTLL